MLERLKTLNVDRIELDEAIELLALAEVVEAKFAAVGLTAAPEYLTDAIRTLKSEIAGRMRDAREKRLKQIRAQKTQLMSADEKRLALSKEEAELEELLK